MPANSTYDEFAAETGVGEPRPAHPAVAVMATRRVGDSGDTAQRHVASLQPQFTPDRRVIRGGLRRVGPRVVASIVLRRPGESPNGAATVGAAGSGSAGRASDGHDLADGIRLGCDA